MSERRTIKTEHSGAKNGGGFWGRREEAKAVSNKARRERGKDEIRNAVGVSGPAPRPKTVHKGDKIREDGAVSALCFDPPRAIDLRRASYVLYQPEDVTCPKCRALLAPRERRQP